MANLAVKPSSKSREKEASGERLQVHEATTTKQRQQVLSFRDQVIIDDIGIVPTTGLAQQRREQAERDKAARLLFLTANSAVAACLRLHTADKIAPSGRWFKPMIWTPLMLSDRNICPSRTTWSSVTVGGAARRRP
ncbi:MAG: hypothetical protein QF512_07205 [Alphaproteobacteria bacterium]|jgi:hypothetical protein|nr:hypothetical protein [Alphaproteobacteria bacterium]